MQDSAALVSRCAAAQQRSVLLRRPSAGPLAVVEVPRLEGLAAVPLTELFTILVDHHGFAVVEAARALVGHLSASGYRYGVESVSAGEALRITEAILGDA